MATSSQILNRLKQFSEEHNVPFYQIGEWVFVASIRGNIGKLEVRCHIGDSYFLFYSTLPIIVPPEKQQAVMEFITLANFGRVVSSFDMDLQIGEVGLKTGTITLDSQLTPNTIAALFQENVGVADYYLKGICQVTYANKEPSVVFRELTKSPEEIAAEEGALRDLLNDPGLDQMLGAADD